MTPPDAASRAATDAGIDVMALAILLHAAAVMDLSQPDRAGFYRKLWAVWPRVTRLMKVLEPLTPTAARLGYDDAAKTRDFVEAST